MEPFLTALHRDHSNQFWALNDPSHRFALCDPFRPIDRAYFLQETAYVHHNDPASPDDVLRHP